MINNNEILKSKKVAYFICCCFNDSWKSYYEKNIPKDLLDNAIIYDTFGREIDIKKGLDKFTIGMVSENTNKNRKIEILKDNIEQFIKLLDY